MLPLPSFSSRLAGIALVLPALLVVALCFIAPLGLSVGGAFVSEQGIGGANFVTALALYTPDILFTLLIVGVSTLLIGLFSVLIGGYLTLGENPRWVALLRWVYRWPLFIPFIVTGQILRTFLAKNGWLNGALDMVGIVDIASASNWLDWRGIVSLSGNRRRLWRCWSLAQWHHWTAGRWSQRAISARVGCEFCSKLWCRRCGTRC